MKLLDIKNVLVIGAGTMGEGIAQNFAQAGLSVRVVARRQETLDTCLRQIEHSLHQFEEFDLLKESLKTILARIQTVKAENLQHALKDCHYVVETIPEVLQTKKEMLLQLQELPQDVIIGSNTSSFTISDLSEGLKYPERIVGLHYFNPAHIIPAVEIHRGKHTSDEAVQLTRELMLKSGKKPILVRKILPGFVVNRITGAMEREIDYLLDNDVITPEELDIVLKGSFGFRLACLGPMEAEDFIGLDTAMRVSGKIFKDLSNATEPSQQLVEKVEKGELGFKSGKGWYDYTNKSKEKVLEERDRKLLRQLALFMEINK
jgi:3-hydroxyacyl-CoA dehydrogenase